MIRAQTQPLDFPAGTEVIPVIYALIYKCSIYLRGHWEVITDILQYFLEVKRAAVLFTSLPQCHIE
jgi:hypothetical protein